MSTSSSTNSSSPPPPRSILKQTPGTPRRQREVAFETVEIHYHAMELGDHPAVSIGAAVTISWECQDEAEFTVDMYELYRTKNRRKSLRLLILNYYKRQEILLNAGYSFEEITAASQEVTQIKRQREITKMLGPLNRVEQATKTARKLKCIRLLGCSRRVG